jgi:hypothetical protein
MVDGLTEDELSNLLPVYNRKLGNIAKDNNG